MKTSQARPTKETVGLTVHRDNACQTKPTTRRWELVSLHLQGWTAVGSLVVSILTLHIVLSTVKDQIATDNSQRKLNQFQQQEYDSRYASHVALSGDTGPGDGAVLIRIANRSVILLGSLVFLDNSHRVGILPGDLPGCTAIELNLTAALDLHLSDIAAWTHATLIFHDPNRLWALDARKGLRADADADIAPFVTAARLLTGWSPPVAAFLDRDGEIILHPFPATAFRREPIADCG